MQLFNHLIVLSAIIASLLGFCNTLSAFDAEHLERLKTFNTCKDCDLSFVDLSKTDLRGAILAAAI